MAQAPHSRAASAGSSVRLVASAPASCSLRLVSTTTGPANAAAPWRIEPSTPTGTACSCTPAASANGGATQPMLAALVNVPAAAATPKRHARLAESARLVPARLSGVPPSTGPTVGESAVSEWAGS